MNEEKNSQSPSDESPPPPDIVEKGRAKKAESPATQDTLKSKERKLPELAPSFFSKKQTADYLAQLLLQYEEEEKQERERRRQEEEKEEEK